MDEPVIDSRAGFHAAVRWGVCEGIARGSWRIVCAGEDFDEWPWDDPVILDALTAWLRQPQRRLQLLARSYAQLSARKPRFDRWRQHFSHAIDARQVPEEWTAPQPTLLVAERCLCVQLIDAVHWRGHASSDRARVQQCMETIDAVLQRSEPAWAVRTLGL